MIKTFQKLFTLFDAAERRQFWILTGVMLLVAGAEIVGISAVLMLLNVLAAPQVIQTSKVLSYAYNHLGLQSPFAFQVALAIVVLIVVMAGLAVKAAGSYATIRFSTMRGYTISSRLLAAYLSQPYPWFLERNSAELGKNVLNEVEGLVTRVIMPCLKLVSNSLLVLAILGLLLLVDPLVTLFSGVVLGLGYGFIYLRIRGRLHRLGEDMMDAFEKRFLVAQEATGGIKDVKVLGLEETYVRSYSVAAEKAAKAGTTLSLMSELPRFVLEAITFGTLLALILILLVKSGGNVTEIVPTLGVIAFSTMRMLPSLQQIYHALVSIRGASAVLDTIVGEKTTRPAFPLPVAGGKRQLKLRSSGRT